MAMEVMKTAAAAYQGSAPVAANQAKPVGSVNKIEAKRPERQAPASDSLGAADTADYDTVKPMQPVNGDPSEDKGGSLGGGQTTKQLQQAVEKLRKNMMARTEAVFGIHEGTNRVMIKIVDQESKDVIKEYPPEQTLDMIQKVWEMAGIMVDERG